MRCTGITFDAEGSPDFLVQSLRERLRELSASLPAGQTRLTLRATVAHPKVKAPKHRRGGNCWAGGTKTDVCMKHEEPRGECSGCQRCPACDAALGGEKGGG